MPRLRILVPIILLGILLPTLSFSQGVRPEKIAAPKFEAVAETQLLMEGMVSPNFRGLEKTLRGKPDADGWIFARGQALLVAESGNLLLLRPPRNQGRDAWMSRAVELRESAVKLARFAAAHDLLHSREILVELAATCNRCHEQFRVATKIRVFGAAEE